MVCFVIEYSLKSRNFIHMERCGAKKTQKGIENPIKTQTGDKTQAGN
jgi:hypothetical protein